MWLGRVFAPPAEWRFIAPADTEGPPPAEGSSALRYVTENYLLGNRPSMALRCVRAREW
jgi:hypothetical protein